MRQISLIFYSIRKVENVYFWFWNSENDNLFTLGEGGYFCFLSACHAQWDYSIGTSGYSILNTLLWQAKISMFDSWSRLLPLSWNKPQLCYSKF